MNNSQLNLFDDIEWPIYDSLSTHFPNIEWTNNHKFGFERAIGLVDEEDFKSWM